MNHSLKTFRLIAFAEGISLIVLLFIAMPVKYLMDEPLLVKIVGWIHGLLFIAYIYGITSVRAKNSWTKKRVFGAFLAGVLPFGTFVFDRMLSKESIHAKTQSSQQGI